MARDLSLFSANVDMMRAPEMAARLQFVVADLISGRTTVRTSTEDNGAKSMRHHYKQRYYSK